MACCVMTGRTMRFLSGRLAIIWIAIRLATSCCALSPVPYVQKTWDQLSDKQVSDWGQIALGIHANSWIHIETTHFIIHCFRDEDKIANRSEAFWGEIREFFGN